MVRIGFCTSFCPLVSPIFFPRDDYDLVRQDSVLGSAILESRATVECTE